MAPSLLQPASLARQLILIAFALTSVAATSATFSQSPPSQANTCLPESSHDAHGSLRNCQKACATLARIGKFPVILPSNATTYGSTQQAYWSAQQAEVAPACFVQPSSADDVSKILITAQTFHCPFAAKSGGHSAFVGGANIPDGITILLKDLNEVIVSSDKTLTKVGTGNRWGDVYSQLMPHNLSVIGGRVSDVGTGGLTLGGGISFFSARYGWACDNVRNYEVVVADGKILNVNRTSYPDLYWALRGGGNNFGIVTRLDLETFPQGPLFGGVYAVDYTANKDRVLDALYWYGHGADGARDVDAAVFAAYVWIADLDGQGHAGWVISMELTHARAVTAPAALANFTAITPLRSTLRVTDLVSLTDEIKAQNAAGLRESFWTHNFVLTPDLMSICVDHFYSVVEAGLKTIPGILPALIFQPMTVDVLAQMQRNGGNALGLDTKHGPLVILSLSVWWYDASDDDEVIGQMKDFIDFAIAQSQKLGAFHPYIYQNYAAHAQDVFAGYGAENHRRLQEISGKYDPRGVFQRLQPGYFKI